MPAPRLGAPCYPQNALVTIRGHFGRQGLRAPVLTRASRCYPPRGAIAGVAGYRTGRKIDLYLPAGTKLPGHRMDKEREDRQIETLSAALTDEERFRLLVNAVTDYAIYMLDAVGPHRELECRRRALQGLCRP